MAPNRLMNTGLVTAWMFSREQGREPIWVPPDGALRVQDTAIPLPELFAEVDRKVEKADAD